MLLPPPSPQSTDADCWSGKALTEAVRAASQSFRTSRRSAAQVPFSWLSSSNLNYCDQSIIHSMTYHSFAANNNKMQKRREAFARQIRTKHKQQIKNGIRRQLLQQDTVQGTHKYLSFVGKQNQCLRQLKEDHIAHLQQQMKALLRKAFNNDISNGQNILDTLRNKLQQATSQNDLPSLIHAYQSAITLLTTIRQTITQKQSQAPFKEMCYIRQWENIFTIMLFRINVSQYEESTADYLYIDSQMNNWINHCLSILRDIWNADNNITFLMHEEVRYIELQQLFLLLSTSQKDLFYLADRYFNEDMIKLISNLLRLHFIDQSIKVGVTEFFLKVSNAKWEVIFNRILDNDYTDYMRMVIAYEQGYKSKYSNSNRVAHRKVNNMLQFIVLASYLLSSDSFIQKGLCSELLAAQKQGLQDQRMRQNIITVIFVLVTNYKYQNTRTLIEQSPIFDWVLHIVDEMIDTSYADQHKMSIITDGIQVIRYFYQLGEFSKTNMNPYRLKLQYSSADMILSKCQEGRAFLREIGWEVEQL